MSRDLKTRLMEGAGAMGTSENGRGKNEKSQNDDSWRTSGQRAKNFVPRRAETLSEDEMVKRLKYKSKAGSGQNERLRRQFLQRLALALHSYGSTSSRTEYLIEEAARRLDLEVIVSVFPSLILLSFPLCKEEDAINVISCSGGLDVDKLGRVDQLANTVGRNETPLLLAYWRLKAIATSPTKFSLWWWRLVGYTLSASMSAVLFFDGSYWDALLSLGLGLVAGFLDLIGERSTLFGSVRDFMTALVVSFLARLLSVYAKPLGVCFYSMTLAPLVQILPGLQLTLGVSEMVSKAHVTGTSRIMYALFSALQLGFGLAVGDNLVFWIKDSGTMSCNASNLSVWWSPLWFIIFSAASNIVLNARLDQWPGMIVTSGIGYLVSWIASQRLNGSTTSVVAAFAVGIAGTLYSRVGDDLPLVRVLAGIRLLVPGGIGVQGVAAMLEDSDDANLSGMGFVFEMMVVGLSICIGLLIAKLCLPTGVFGSGTSTVNTNFSVATLLQDDEAAGSSSDEENPSPYGEHMAI